MSIPKEIKSAIEDNNLVVFVGSGLSIRFGLPNWVKLVKDVILKIDDKFKILIPPLESGIMTPMEVLEKIKIEQTLIRRYIKENFKIKNDNNDLFSCHKNLLELSGKIITTNYDNAFQIASDYEIDPSVYNSKFNLSEINRADNPYILKLHGNYASPDECVIFKEDYDKLYSAQDYISAIKTLESIFIGKTILFLGFSFNDPDINYIFNNLDAAFGNNIKHYILTTTPNDFEKYNFLKPISIDTFSEIDDFVDECIQFKNSINATESANKTIISDEKINSPELKPVKKMIINNRLNDFNKPTVLFTGRQEKLEELDNAYRKYDIISITGIGGFGKTELVVKYIEGFEKEKKEKITWQDFTESTQFDNFIAAAGFDFILTSNKKEREKFSALVDKFNEYKRIVIWDNFHENTDDAFLRFLEFADKKLKESKIIIISRTNEKTRNFKGIELVDFTESIEYAKLLIKDRYKNIKLSDDEIKNICNYVKGHPLAINLILNLCGSIPLKRVLGNLTKCEIGIDELSQRLFKQILEQDTTSKEERDFLYQFSIFTGKVSEDTIESIFGEDCFYNTLQLLKEKYFIEFDSGYYDTHPLIREFCYQKLENKNELHSKVANFLISQRTDDLDTLLEERIFHHLKGAEEYEYIAQTIKKYGRNYILRAFYQPLLEMITLTASKNLSEPLFDILNGDICKIRGEWDNALSFYEKTKENIQDEELAVEGLLKCAEVFNGNGDTEKALKSYQEVKTISEQKNIEKYIAWAYNGIAVIKEREGIYTEAHNLLMEALSISQRLGIKEDIADLYNNIGSDYLEINFKDYNLNKALEYFQSSLEIGLEIDYKQGIANSYNSIGLIYGNKDYKNYNLNITYENFQRSFEIKLEIGDKEGVEISYIYLSSCYREKDFRGYNIDKALEYLQKSLEIGFEIGNKEGIALAYDNFGYTYYLIDFKGSDLNKAIEFYQKSIEIKLEIGAKVGIAESYYKIGVIKWDKKEYKTCLLDFFNSYAIYKQLNAKKNVTDCKYNLSEVLNKIGKTEFKKHAAIALAKLEPEYQKEIKISDFLLEPIKVRKHYERNDRITVKYTNGDIFEKKFKQVEIDIASGKCKVVLKKND